MTEPSDSGAPGPPRSTHSVDAATRRRNLLTALGMIVFVCVLIAIAVKSSNVRF